MNFVGQRNVPEIVRFWHKFLIGDSGATVGTCPVIAPFTIEMGPLEPLPDGLSDMVCRLRVLRLDENGRPVYGTPTGETP